VTVRHMHATTTVSEFAMGSFHGQFAWAVCIGSSHGQFAWAVPTASVYKELPFPLPLFLFFFL
jgi:hypothetical protein